MDKEKMVKLIEDSIALLDDSIKNPMTQSEAEARVAEALGILRAISYLEGDGKEKPLTIKAPSATPGNKI